MTRKRVLTGVILLAALVLPVIAAPPEGKSTADLAAAVAEKWIAVWNSHDPDKMLQLFTDDVFYEDVPFGEVSHGSAELRKFFLSELRASPISNSSCRVPLFTAATEPSNGCLVVPTKACSRPGKSFLSEASA